MKENKFWIARRYNKKDRPLIVLYNNKPSIYDYNSDNYDYPKYYKGLKEWDTWHGKYYIKSKYKEFYDRFKDLNFEDGPIECKLIPDNDTPIFYIQRYNDNLFIGELDSHRNVYHINRISNKLFPEIKSGDNPIGFNIIVCSN